MVPKLRFKEFCGKWEEKRLGDICKIYDGTHQTPKYVEKGIKFLSVENIKNIYKSNKHITEDAFKKEFKNNQICKNDILMTRIGDIGTTAIVKTDEPFAYYVSLALLKCNEKINPFFLTQFIEGQSFQSELWKRTLHIAFPKKINKGEIGECKISVPSLPEQTKIADFLSTVDDKIQNQQDKITHLENIKKGFIQKIFSRKIRFKDDGGEEFPEWEDRKLGEISYSISSGKSSKDLQGKYNLYGSTGIIGRTNNIECQGEFILVARVGVNAGQVNCINGIYGVSDNTIIIRNKEEIISKFLYYRLEFYNINRLVFGSGQTLVTSTDLKKIKIKIPSKKEQQKISDFLSAFDEKISTEKETLEHLKQLKKGLLQQMFV